MKKLITIFTVFTYLLLLAGCEAGTIAATDASTYFNDVIMPWLITFGVAAGGVASVLVPLLSKINRSRKTFDMASDSVAQAHKETDRLRKELAATEKALADKLAGYEGEIAGIKDDLPAVRGMLEKLLEVEKHAYLDSPALVANGTARKIAEVYDGKKTETENKG